MLFHHFSVDLDKLHIYEVVLIYSIKNYQKRIPNIFNRESLKFKKIQNFSYFNQNRLVCFWRVLIYCLNK